MRVPILASAVLAVTVSSASAQPAPDAWPPTIPDLRMQGPCLRYPGSPNQADLGRFLTVINTCDRNVSLAVSLTPFGGRAVVQQACVPPGGPRNVPICVQVTGIQNACESLVHIMPMQEGNC
jgi:hypothetical protein